MNRIVIDRKILDMFSINYEPDMTVYVLVAYAFNKEEATSKILQISKDIEQAKRVITSTNEVTREAKTCIAPVDRSDLAFLIFEICEVHLVKGQDTLAKTVEFYIFDGEVNEYICLGNISREAVLEAYRLKAESFNEEN